MTELIIYLVIGIIYAISSATGYNGRYSRRGRYGLFNADVFEIDDSLSSIREEYEQRLKIYYENHVPRMYLKNNYCELRLIKDDSGTHFYCKERTDGIHKGRFFEVQGNTVHASTMWGMIDMVFDKKSSYQSIKSLYNKLNKSYNTTGGLSFFYEPVLKKYPNYDDKSAQNEYCRMELQTLPSGQRVIICSQVWGKQAKRFVISGNKSMLQKAISDFAKEKNKMQTYEEILAKFSIKPGYKVKELTEDDIIKSSYDYVENAEISKSPKSDSTSVEYLHADIDDSPKEEKLQDNKNEAQPKEIKRYDERNLDL